MREVSATAKGVEGERRTEDAPVSLERRLDLGERVLVELVDALSDGAGLLLERHADDLLLPRADELGLDDGLGQQLLDAQALVRLLGVDRQVVGRPVGAADALDPAVRRLDLGVPAVGGVVRHLVRHVLAEAQAGGVDADRHEELVDARDEVAERLVVDDALVERNGGEAGGSAREERRRRARGRRVGRDAPGRRPRRSRPPGAPSCPPPGRPWAGA